MQSAFQITPPPSSTCPSNLIIPLINSRTVHRERRIIHIQTRKRIRPVWPHNADIARHDVRARRRGRAHDVAHDRRVFP
jgi:hypothetical protein